MLELEGFVPFDFSAGIPSVSITPNGVTFNKSVAIKLNYPEHVVLLISAEKKQMAIIACSEDTDRSTAFYKKRERDKPAQSVRWNNRDLLNCLSEMMEWELTQTSHRVEGKLLPSGDAMIFDLNHATDMK